MKLKIVKTVLCLLFLTATRFDAYTQSLRPIDKCGNLYCYNLEQIRAIAILVVEKQHNDSIVFGQDIMIKDYQLALNASDSIIDKQKEIICNSETIIANDEILRHNEKVLFDIEKDSLTHKNLKQKKRFVAILAILVGLIILK